MCDDKLQNGSVLKLKHEVNNEYDYFAVAIYSGSWKVGYIPRDEAPAVSVKLRKGINIECVIEKYRKASYFNQEDYYDIAIGLKEI